MSQSNDIIILPGFTTTNTPIGGDNALILTELLTLLSKVNILEGNPLYKSVQTVNGQSGTVTITLTDLGGASIQQGKLAETALQPDDIVNLVDHLNQQNSKVEQFEQILSEAIDRIVALEKHEPETPTSINVYIQDEPTQVQTGTVLIGKIDGAQDASIQHRWMIGLDYQITDQPLWEANYQDGNGVRYSPLINGVAYYTPLVIVTAILPTSITLSNVLSHISTSTQIDTVIATIESDGNPKPTYTLVNSPSWLSINENHAIVVSSTPTPGSFQVHVNAGNINTRLDLTVSEPEIVTVSISGDPDVVTSGQTLQGLVFGAPAGAMIEHRWTNGITPYSNANEVTFTPRIGVNGVSDSSSVIYAPLINGIEYKSNPATVVYSVPTTIGTISDLTLTQGAPASTGIAADYFAGDDLVYEISGDDATISPDGLWSISTQTLRENDLVTITARNSGGSTSLTFTVTVRAPTTALLWIGDYDHNTVQLTASGITGATTVQFVAKPTGGSVDITTGPIQVDSDYGFARASLSGLQAGMNYTVEVHANGAIAGETGRFRTRPVARSAFSVGFASCHVAGRDDAIFDTIADRNLAAFYHLGDRGYADIPTNDPALYHAADDAVMAAPRVARLHRSQPLIYTWDDHDYGPNNAIGTAVIRPAAVSWFRSRVPARLALSGAQDSVYRMHTPMPGVHVAMLDVRADRYSTAMMLSADQEAWLVSAIQSLPSDEVLVIASGVPWISDSSTDTWFGAAGQRQRIADAVEAYAPGRVMVIAGDAHMLAFDNGTNAPGGVPVYQAAPLATTNSTKGGPYSGGTVTATQNQYGTLDFTPITGGWQVRYRGWSVDAMGNQTVRLDHTAQMLAPSAPNPVTVAPQITTVPSITGNPVVGSILTAVDGAASGDPTPLASRVWTRNGNPAGTGPTLDTTGWTASDVIGLRVTWTNGTAPDAVADATPLTLTAAPAQPGGNSALDTYAAAIMQHNPQFLLGEVSGGSMIDLSGNERHGQIVGVPGSHIIAGPQGLPFFAGTTNSHIWLPHEPIFNEGDWTVGFWYHVNGVSSDNAGWYHRGDGERITSRGAAGGAAFRVNGSSSGESLGVMPPADWGFVALTRDAATGRGTLYTAHPGRPLAETRSITGTVGAVSSEVIMFNGRNIAGVVDRRVNSAHAGMFRVPVALTIDQLTEIYNAPKSEWTVTTSGSTVTIHNYPTPQTITATPSGPNTVTISR